MFRSRANAGERITSPSLLSLRTSARKNPHIMRPPALLPCLARCLTLVGALALTHAAPLAAEPAALDLNWLGASPPPISTGVSWGVPWPRGQVSAEQAFALTAPDGQRLPLQTWPLAYWPDGSLKWSGFATVAGPHPTGSPRLEATGGATAEISGPVVQVRRSDVTFEIDTGPLRVRIRILVTRSFAPCRSTVARSQVQRS